MNKMLHTVSIVTLAFGVLACNNDSEKIDDALNSDLSLASQARPFNPLDSVTAAERAAQLQNTQRQPAPVRRTTYSSSRSSAASSAASTSRPAEPEYRVEKNTKRDAAIGAGAGAVIGVATSKDKVKGGLIGAAAGGLLGAIIGNNVDKKKVPVNK